MTSVRARKEAIVSSLKPEPLKFEPGTLNRVPSACGTRTNSA
jgi:hypothetical protein